MTKPLFIAGLLFALAAVPGPWIAAAEKLIHRCVGEDGSLIFSDRQCIAFGAREHAPILSEESAIAALSPVAEDCPREVDTLLERVRRALEAGDVNQLSGLYHWLDATSGAADTIMSGLEAVVERGVIDLELEPGFPEALAQPARLWLEQADPQHPDTRIVTSFSLVVNAGCWWLYR